MLKAGFIGAFIGFIYTTSLYLVAPLCTICLMPILGASVGYLAVWFDKPSQFKSGMIKSMIASAITGGVVIIGQIIATIVKGVLITNWEWLGLAVRELGWPDIIITEYWQNAIVSDSLCGILNNYYWFFYHWNCIVVS